MKTFKTVEELIEFVSDKANIETLDSGEVPPQATNVWQAFNHTLTTRGFAGLFVNEMRKTLSTFENLDIFPTVEVSFDRPHRIGWGAIYCDGGDKTATIKKVAPGWWQLMRKDYPVFGGSQAVLVNKGQWRMGLAGKIFRCDVELCKVLHEIGVTQIYHTDKTLIGTNDPHSVFGTPSVICPFQELPQSDVKMPRKLRRLPISPLI